MPWWINVLFTNKSEKVMVNGTPLRMTVFFQLLLCSMSAFTSKHTFTSCTLTRKPVSKQLVTWVRYYVHTHEPSVNDTSLKNKQADMLWSYLQHRTDLAQYKASSTICRIHKVGWNNCFVLSTGSDGRVDSPYIDPLNMEAVELFRKLWFLSR